MGTSREREKLGKLIKHAIDNEKLLFVSYKNSGGEIVKFWLAIFDIIFDEKNTHYHGKNL